MNNKSRDFIDSFLYTVLAILGGIVILFLSVTRAGFELMAKDNNENKLRNNLIEFTYLDDNGEKQEYDYLLPTTSTLPNNPFYGFKKVRDFLWLRFSQGEINKCKTAFLLADKKMTVVAPSSLIAVLLVLNLSIFLGKKLKKLNGSILLL